LSGNCDVNVSTREFTEARQAVADLLEELGLEAYVFEIEPRAHQWQVRVDCGFSGGWQSTTLAIDVARLRDSRSNKILRAQLLKDWGERLAACRYPGPGSE
jgi:hypothetical protein